MPKHPDWNPDAPIGTQVCFITGRNGHTGCMIRKIGRVTKTQVVLTPFDTKLDRATGRQLGRDYDYWQPYTDEIKNRIDAEERERALRYWAEYEAPKVLSKLPSDQLQLLRQQIEALVEDNKRQAKDQSAGGPPAAAR